jgi:Na+/proline symporter
MPGLFIAVLLIASLLLVHFSMRARPMARECPLDVDEGLPLPEAGQASSVFSLTALFGAYFGIYLVLGLPALAGLACGTVLGLALIRHWIRTRSAATFEGFLLEILQGKPGNATAFGLALAAVQCAFAGSELLILREITRVALGLRSDHATILVIGLAIIGYFYVLFGGYMAVFRTDVLQFAMVAAMAVALGIVAFRLEIPAGWTARLAPRPGYWELPVLGGGWWLYAYHFFVGTVMGLGFLAASPDTWKRVFIVTKLRGRTRFWIFLIVGVTPFLLLLLLGIPTAPIPNGAVNAGQMFSAMLTSELLFVAASLGLVASFLSSFDSALLAAVQVGLILQRKKAPVEFESARFHWLMVTGLLTICLLFAALIHIGNPYLLANLLLGAYAIVAGVEIGSVGLLEGLPENSVLWILVVGFVGWFLYFVSNMGLPSVATTYQINTVPGGVLLCLLVAFACQLLVLGGRRNATH